MKIVILQGGNKLFYKNKDDYTVKTTIGNFTNVNEVIKKYPAVKDDKHIEKCVWCGKYFIKLGRGSANKKTCSDSCSIENRRQRNRNNMNKHKLFVKHQNQRVIDEYKKNKGLLPSGFHQIDSNKTMGETILWDGLPKKQNGVVDFDKEKMIINKLKKNLFKNNIIND